MPQQISVRIDNELYTATDGQTILQVAADNGRSIPTLCYLEGLSAPGSCRLCLVEVAGVGRLLPACTTPARSGMSVTTNSESLAHNRRWRLSCCSSSATMSARSASPTVIANCSRWRRHLA